MARVYLPLLLLLASPCTHSERNSNDRESTAFGKPSDTIEDLFRVMIELLLTILERLRTEYLGSSEECIHKCPSEMKLVASEKHTAPNGCGAFGIQGVLSALMVLLPDVESCCNEHDKCYDTCNMSRDSCDVMFYDCLKTLCTELCLSADGLYVCHSLANVTYHIPKLLGCRPYRQAQRSACVCVEPGLMDYVLGFFF